MTAELRTPDRRECERCGRQEVWDDESDTWRVHAEDGDRRVADPFCIHEWDINGTFAPFGE